MMTTDTAEDKAQKPADKKDWLAEHIKYLSALKTPTDTQKLLILLAGKSERTQNEERTFAAVVKSEKALERAKKARAEVAGLLAKEKEEAAKAAEAARKARNHKLIELGLLFGFAELDESPREFLMGLLLMGSKTDELNRQKLTQIGADFFAKKEPKKEKDAAPAAPVAAAPALRPAPAPAAPATAKTYLTTGFKDKETVKALGAHFDYDAKKWFVPPGLDLTPFKQWMV